MALRFVGSLIATMSAVPAREIGMIRCFSQISLVTSLPSSASSSTALRSMEGTRYSCARKFAISFSEM